MNSRSVLISLVFISFFIGGANPSALADLDRWTDFELKGARVDAVAFHPGDSDIIYLGTRGRGLYKSRDGGDTWAPVESFHQLVHHPANDTEFRSL